MQSIWLDLQFYLALTALFLVFVGIPIALYVLPKRLRARSLKKIADKLGYSYVSAVDKDLQSNLQDQFQLMARTYKGPHNIVSSQNMPIKWSLFEYHAAKLSGVRAGRGSSYDAYTVFCGTSDDFNFKHFCMAPETLADKINMISGEKDINFEDYPAFSKKYYLKGTDEAEVRKIFTPALIQLLESKKRRVSMEAYRNNVLIYKSGVLKPRSVESHSKEALEIIEILRNNKHTAG